MQKSRIYIEHLPQGTTMQPKSTYSAQPYHPSPTNLLRFNGVTRRSTEQCNFPGKSGDLCIKIPRNMDICAFKSQEETKIFEEQSMKHQKFRILGPGIAPTFRDLNEYSLFMLFSKNLFERDLRKLTQSRPATQDL